jgi:hypothetical protein
MVTMNNVFSKNKEIMQQNNSSSSPHQLLICGLAILIFEILTKPLLRLGFKNDEELIFAMWC